jgi:hypothetical protein
MVSIDVEYEYSVFVDNVPKYMNNKNNNDDLMIIEFFHRYLLIDYQNLNTAEHLNSLYSLWLMAEIDL